MSNVQVNSTVLPSELAQILESNQVQIGSQISYQLCKLLWEYHPLAGKIIEKPVRLALSKSRKITIPCAIEDQLKEAFEREWDRLGATNHIRDTMYLSRVYGAAAIVYGAPNVPTDQPIDPWMLAEIPDLYFNQLDPLNLAGSIVTNQNPNSPDFQKPNQSITAAGQPYHHSRSCTVFCGTPIYLAFQGSSFSFSGRSLFLRALYPLKSFIQTMTVDDLVSLKSGLLVAKIEQSGSIVNRLMQNATGGKRELLKEAQTGNVLSISPEESIESIDMNNTDKAMTTARNNIIANIAAACDVPAILLKDEAFTQGFGEGTEDAKAVAQYIEGLRHDMHDLFEFFDKIVQHRAWNRDFYESLVNEYPEDMGAMTYEQFFYFVQNQFRSTFPTLYEEPESEKIKRDSDKLKAMSDVLKTLGEMVDPENKARVVEWFTDNINGMTELFTSPITLDIEALAQYEPPQPQGGMFGQEGGENGQESPEQEPPAQEPPPNEPPPQKKGVEARQDADWEESKHPRDEAGRFTSGGGSSGSAGETSQAAAGGQSQFNRKARQPHEPKPVDKKQPTVEEQYAERENDLKSIDIPQAAGSSITPDQTRATLGAKYKEAAERKPKYDELMNSIASDMGIQQNIMLAPLKGVPRAIEKISGDYKGDANKIKDLVRGTIVVDNFEQTLQAVELISQRMGKPIGFRNGLIENSKAESPDGYRDIKMNIEIDGHMTEVQVNFKEMIEAKDGKGHKLYEAAREIESKAAKENRKPTEEEKMEMDRLFAEQQNLYNAAWDKIQARARKEIGGGSLDDGNEKKSYENLEDSGLSIQKNQQGYGVATVDTSAPLINQLFSIAKVRQGKSNFVSRASDRIAAAEDICFELGFNEPDKANKLIKYIESLSGDRYEEITGAPRDYANRVIGDIKRGMQSKEWRAKNDDEHWITLNGNKGEGEGRGQHVLINGSGQVVGGAGGKLAGKTLERVTSKSGNVEKKAEQPTPEPEPAPTPKEEPKYPEQEQAKAAQEAIDWANKSTEALIKSPEWDERKARREISSLRSGDSKVIEHLKQSGISQDRIDGIVESLIERLNAGTQEALSNRRIEEFSTSGYWSSRFANHLLEGSSDPQDTEAEIIAQLGVMGLSEKEAKTVIENIKSNVLTEEWKETRRSEVVVDAKSRIQHRAMIDSGNIALSQSEENAEYNLDRGLQNIQNEKDELVKKLIKMGQSKEAAEAQANEIGKEQEAALRNKAEETKKRLKEGDEAEQRQKEKRTAREQGDAARFEKVSTNFVKYTPQKNAKEAAKFAVENGYVDNANFGKMAMPVINAQMESLSNHLEKFPRLAFLQRSMGSMQKRHQIIKDLELEHKKADIERIVRATFAGRSEEQLQDIIKHRLKKIRAERIKKSTWAYSAGEIHTQEYAYDSVGVFYNEESASVPDEFQKALDSNVETKYHPVGCNTFKSVADHEYGHQMDLLLNLSARTRSNYGVQKSFEDDRLETIYKEAQKHDPSVTIPLFTSPLQEKVSRYAAKNPQEFIAECWAEYLNNPEPRPVSKSVGELIETIYKEKFG